MAVKIGSKPNTELLDADYPLGRHIDYVPGNPGTPINNLTLGDWVQFFLKMFDESGLIYNDDPDNETNGYQLYDSLQVVTGMKEWTTGAKPIATTNNPPTATVTIQTPDVIINKYRRVGKTLYWNLKLENITTAGTFSEMYLTSPISITPPAWINAGMQVVGFINGSPDLIVETSSVTSAGQITLKMVGGGNFATGTNNQSLDLTIIAEIA